MCTLVLPSFVKLAHAFDNHKHEACVVPQKLHYHELELDCEFYKFKLKENQYFSTIIITQSTDYLEYAEIYDKYYSLNKSLQLTNKNLRGPPQLLTL